MKAFKKYSFMFWIDNIQRYNFVMSTTGVRMELLKEQSFVCYGC